MVQFQAICANHPPLTGRDECAAQVVRQDVFVTTNAFEDRIIAEPAGGLQIAGESGRVAELGDGFRLTFRRRCPEHAILDAGIVLRSTGAARAAVGANLIRMR